MEDTKAGTSPDVDVQGVVQKAIAEYLRQDSTRREPALKAELQEERRKREGLEKRLNQMAEENRKSREAADQAERSAKIKSELQALGVVKVDLAYKAIQDGILRADDGRLVAKNDGGETPLREYLANFVQENPEFLPARIAGGTGIVANSRTSEGKGPIDLEFISPAMSNDEKERVRQEILRVTNHAPRGF